MKGARRHTMAKITEKQLIDSLKQLKEIKPRKEWALLLKSQILTEKQAEIKTTEHPAQFAGFMNIFSQKQMAYSFATLLLLIAGVFGLVKLLPSNTAPQQTASLIRQTGLTHNVADLNVKITELKKNLKNTSLTNLQTAKAVADQIQKIKQLQTKTLADVLSAPDEKSLKDALSSADSTLAPLIENEINDLQKTTLTADQQKILVQAQDLYKKGDYSGALEKIWDLSNNSNSNTTNLQSLINTTSPTNK